LVPFSDPEQAASATRAAHDPVPHVSALFSTAPPISVQKRSVRQFSNYLSAQVIFKGGM